MWELLTFDLIANEHLDTMLSNGELQKLHSDDS